jgi:hypothetical protein
MQGVANVLAVAHRRRRQEIVRQQRECCWVDSAGANVKF